MRETDIMAEHCIKCPLFLNPLASFHGCSSRIGYSDPTNNTDRQRMFDVVLANSNKSFW